MPGEMSRDPSNEFSSDDRTTLIEIARRAISSAVIENGVPDVPSYPPALGITRGVFVSLYRSGTLRGCVGQVENPGPLAELVAYTAVHAALHDARFPPLGLDEIAEVCIELSVLSPLELVAPEAVIAGQPGQVGLMVVRERRKGLLLPQVAAERHWSGERFLEETCAKAGLPRNAWQDSATQIFAFTAEVFSDAKLRSIPIP
jgi:uncharacterized protein